MYIYIQLKKKWEGILLYMYWSEPKVVSDFWSIINLCPTLLKDRSYIGPPMDYPSLLTFTDMTQPFGSSLYSRNLIFSAENGFFLCTFRSAPSYIYLYYLRIHKNAHSNVIYSFCDSLYRFWKAGGASFTTLLQSCFLYDLKHVSYHTIRLSQRFRNCTFWFFIHTRSRIQRTVTNASSSYCVRNTIIVYVLPSIWKSQPVFNNTDCFWWLHIRAI